jgi:hypothetical protein
MICGGGQNINIRRKTDIIITEICIAVDVGGILVGQVIEKVIGI